MRRLILLTFSHGATLAIGFALGIYLLPILTAPDAPDAAMLEERSRSAVFSGTFTRDLRGSDFLHWGEGTISLTEGQVVHEGRLSPGPDYKLYLTTAFVEHEDEFNPLKAEAQLIGDVKTFEGFILDIPDGVDTSAFTTAVVWCESFGEFITAAKYQ